LTDVPDEWLTPGTIFYLGGFLMMPKLESPETLEVLQRARSRGCRIMLDVVLYGNRPYWDAIKPLLPYTDIFAPNDHEAERICGLSDPLDQAKFFLAAGAGAVVITCGEKGTLYYSTTEKFRLDAFPAEFVGGTGAGDAFSSGFIAAMHRNLPPVECVTWGSALGASCVRHIGATQSVFSLAELQEFLANHSVRCTEIA
jgi:sugar/nucleoside kinase (ribokinase family)